MREIEWQIGKVRLDNRLVIAPMAGVSNIAFRGICRRFGAGLVCAEMVSDKALYYDNARTVHMTQVMEDEHPVSMQIFGHDIDTMSMRPDCSISTAPATSSTSIWMSGEQGHQGACGQRAHEGA